MERQVHSLLLERSVDIWVIGLVGAYHFQALMLYEKASYPHCMLVD